MRRVFVLPLAGLLVLLSGLGCEKAPKTTEKVPGPAVSAAAVPAAEQIKRISVPSRLVAIGDLHGDMEASRAALRMGGAIDESGKWVGGNLVVVQTGDQLDRGDSDRQVVDMLERLGDEAKAVGGAVIVLNGNHEMMNVQLNFDYVTEGALKDHQLLPGLDLGSAKVMRMPEGSRGRAASYMPGGPYAKKLAKRDTIAIVGDTLFVHGGLLPKHVSYGLQRMNQEVRLWMEGKGPEPVAVLAQDGPVWNRRYSASAGPEDCKVLKEALEGSSTKRMVVGHTPQRGGISPACSELVWRIDVGLSKFYGGPTEVLEITGDSVRVIRKPK